DGLWPAPDRCADKAPARHFFPKGFVSRFPRRITPRSAQFLCITLVFCGIFARPQTGAVRLPRIRLQADFLIAFSSARTASAWPLAVTFRQMRATLPAGEIRNVARSVPMNLRPYMLFSTQTP